MKSFNNYDDNILFVLSSAHWKMNRVLRQRFKKEKLQVSPDQWLIMLNLMDQGSMTQKQLANSQYKDKSSIKRLLDHLKDKGLIQKKKSKKDLRKNLVFLSGKGHEVIIEMNEVAQKAFQTACNDLKEVELNALKRLINMIEET